MLLSKRETIMNSNIQNLPAIFRDHLFRQLSNEDLKQAERGSQNYSNQTGKRNAYLNYLCLSSFQKYLQENRTDVKQNPLLTRQQIPAREGYRFASKWKASKNHQARLADKLLAEPLSQFNLTQARANISPIMWEFVNGSTLELNGKKLVIIPSDATDLESFDIPQEWVDIPTFAADYYLPVQVDLEAKYLHFWGFISRQNLKQKAEYDLTYRLYTVEGYHVIENFELLWVASEMCHQEKGEISPLPPLEETEAKALIETLSQPSPYSPRLEVKFEQWGALLSDEDWLQELHLERLIKSPNRPPVLWLKEQFNQPTSLGAKPPTNQQSTLAYRGKLIRKSSAKSFPSSDLKTSEKIRWFIQNLANRFSLDIPSNLADEDILLHLLIKSPRQISGEVAEFFWEIASSEPLSANKQVITILMQLAGYPIILNVASVQTPSQKVALLLRVYSTGEHLHLPPGLRLEIRDEKGHPLPRMEATVRKSPLDKCIQLYFRADVGDRFSCLVNLEQDSLTEDFII